MIGRLILRGRHQFNPGGVPIEARALRDAIDCSRGSIGLGAARRHGIHPAPGRRPNRGHRVQTGNSRPKCDTRPQLRDFRVAVVQARPTSGGSRPEPQSGRID